MSCTQFHFCFMFNVERKCTFAKLWVMEPNWRWQKKTKKKLDSSIKYADDVHCTQLQWDHNFDSFVPHWLVGVGGHVDGIACVEKRRKCDQIEPRSELISIPGSHTFDNKDKRQKLPPTRKIVAGHQWFFALVPFISIRIAFFPVINWRRTNG